MTSGLVWYVAYGSNCDADRFRCYLEGGRPRGATAANPGARDPSPPLADRALVLDRAVRFAGTSTTWGGGGVAFLELVPTPGTTTLARAYLVTEAQFCDVLAQESGRQVGSVGLDPATLGDGQALVVHDGWYGTALGLGAFESHPQVTFTSIPPAPKVPARAYLDTIVTGLAAVHQLTAEEILATYPGLPGSLIGL